MIFLLGTKMTKRVNPVLEGLKHLPIKTQRKQLFLTLNQLKLLSTLRSLFRDKHYYDFFFTHTQYLQMKKICYKMLMLVKNAIIYI